MVINEIFWSLANCNKNGTAYSISDQLRIDLSKSVPEVEWNDHNSNAYELTRLIGQNVKWKLNYKSFSLIDTILNSVSMVDW